MMKRYKKVLLLLTTVFILWGLWPIKTLVMTDGQGHRLMLIPVEEDQQMVYTSIHSVSNTPLEETLTVVEGGFLAVKVRYKDQSGAGLPEFTYDQAEFYTEDGWLVIEGFDRRYEGLSFRVNQVYDNRLKVNGSEILLYNLVEGSKGEVDMKIANRSRWLVMSAKH